MKKNYIEEKTLQKMRSDYIKEEVYKKENI